MERIEHPDTNAVGPLEIPHVPLALAPEAAGPSIRPGRGVPTGTGRRASHTQAPPLHRFPRWAGPGSTSSPQAARSGVFRGEPQGLGLPPAVAQFFVVEIVIFGCERAAGPLASPLVEIDPEHPAHRCTPSVQFQLKLSSAQLSADRASADRPGRPSPAGPARCPGPLDATAREVVLVADPSPPQPPAAAASASPLPRPMTDRRPRQRSEVAPAPAPRCKPRRRRRPKPVIHPRPCDPLRPVPPPTDPSVLGTITSRNCLQDGVVHPVVIACPRAGAALGSFATTGSRPIAAPRASSHSRRCNKPVDEAVPDVAPASLHHRRHPRATVPNGSMAHHLQLRLCHHPVEVDPPLVDPVARQRLVLTQPRSGKSVKGSWVARNDSHAMSSIGSPRWASSQSTTAVTLPPAYMKFPGPVSPWTSTRGPE